MSDSPLPIPLAGTAAGRAASRAATASALPLPAVPTAADLLARIDTWTDLTESGRKVYVNAVRCYCKALGRRAKPELVPMPPAAVLAFMDKASPAELDLKPSSLRNVRSALRVVFRRVGLLAPVRRAAPIASPAWAALVDALPARFQPHRLRAFCAWCDAEGIPSEAVTSATLHRYLDHRTATHGGPNLRNDMAEVARQWNRMIEAVPGWPATRLALAPVEGRLVTPAFSDYPPELRADIAAFERWAGTSTTDDLLAEGAGEPFSKATLRSRLTALRLLLWALTETGTPREAITSLDPLLEPVSLVRALQHHRTRLGVQRSVHLGQMAAAVQAVMAFRRIEGQRAQSLRAIFAKVRPPAQREVTPKVADMLEALSQPAARHALLHLPSTLMAEAARLQAGWTTRRGEHRAPDPLGASWLAAKAVAVEILLHLPLRVADLARLRIGHELQLRQLRPNAWEARLRVETSKTGRVVETILGREGAALLRRYMDVFRPLGPNAESDWLFPSRDDPARPRTEHHFSEAIGTAVNAHCGVRVTVHGFRSFVACLILENNPHAWDDVQAVLGHSSLVMAQRHYARINRLAAGARLSEGLERQRRRLGRRPGPVINRGRDREAAR
jgi:integrase